MPHSHCKVVAAGSASNLPALRASCGDGVIGIEFFLFAFLGAVDSELGRLLDQTCENPSDGYSLGNADGATRMSYLKNLASKQIKLVTDNNGFQARSGS